MTRHSPQIACSFCGAESPEKTRLRTNSANPLVATLAGLDSQALQSLTTGSGRRAVKAITMRKMSVAIGRIRSGQVVVEGDGEPLPEGRRVTLVIEDEEVGFHLDEASIRALREAQAEIRRGNYATEEQVLKELDED